MDERLQTILDANRNLLEFNLLLTEDLLKKLVHEDVITQSMREEIQECTCRKKCIAKLLDLITLRGNHAFISFSKLLQGNGHVFLGEHLVDEIEGITEEFHISTEEIIKKLPFAKSLSQEEQRAIHIFIDSKVTEKVLHATIRSAPMEKERARITKAQCLDQIADLKDKLLQKEEEISSLELQLMESSLKSEYLHDKTESLQEEIAKLNTKCAEDFAKQKNFAIAGNNEAFRMQDRLSTFDSQIRLMNQNARVYFKPDDADEISRDPDNIRVSLLEKNFDKLMQRIKELEVIKENTWRQLQEQSKTILQALNMENDGVKPSQAVTNHIEEEQQGLDTTLRELVSLGNNIHTVLETSPVTPKTSREHTVEIFYENNKKTKQNNEEVKKKSDFKTVDSKIEMLYSDIDHIKLEWKQKEQHILALQNENEQLRLQIKVSQARSQSIVDKIPSANQRELGPLHVQGQLNRIPTQANHINSIRATETLSPTLETTDVLRPKGRTSPHSISPRSENNQNNMTLPPILSSASTSPRLSPRLEKNSDPVSFIKHGRKSLDPLDPFRTPRGDSPDPRSASQLSTRSDKNQSDYPKRPHIQTVQFPQDWRPGQH